MMSGMFNTQNILIGAFAFIMLMLSSCGEGGTTSQPAVKEKTAEKPAEKKTEVTKAEKKETVKTAEIPKEAPAEKKEPVQTGKTEQPAVKKEKPAEKTEEKTVTKKTVPEKRESKLQTRETSWCTITVPQSAHVGEKIRISLKLTATKGLKAQPETVYVSCDLKDENHKMMQWGGKPKPLKVGEEASWELTVKDKLALKNVYALIIAYKAPEDGWGDNIGNVGTPLVKVTGAEKLPEIEYNKSWIKIQVQSAADKKPGDDWDIPVEYFMDPSEFSAGTKLNLWGTGPWMDNPDGKYVKKRHHESFKSYLGGDHLVQPGRHTHVFKVKVPEPLPQPKKWNDVLFIAKFVDPAGKAWPWQRRGWSQFANNTGHYFIDTDKPGNLFTYDEQVEISAELRNVDEKGAVKTLTYTIHDTSGEQISEGSREFVVGENGQKVMIRPQLKERGILLINIKVDGWEDGHCTFGRIPDVKKLTNDEVTNFGFTNALGEESIQIARKLGLSYCRKFVGWASLNPAPGEYNFEGLGKQLDTAKKYGVIPWICLTGAPSFALDEKGKNPGYGAFRAKWDMWENFIKAASEAYKGKIWGFEWLNEIVPASDDPVGNYLRFVTIGYETMKSVDPDMKSMLAGGLWPRSYRLAVLKAGIGTYIDSLPVHYSNGGGIMEARTDLDSAGNQHVEVWDNESGRGINAWNVPPIEELQNTEQCKWVLTQWADELVAGCKVNIYFGGEASAAGNWSFMLDDNSPRPLAATLAVFTSTLHNAEPVGKFSLGSGAMFHVFEKDGKAILAASSYAPDGETVDLPVGAASVTKVDYQGNETVLTCADNNASLVLGRLPYFVRGIDVDVMKAFIAPSVASASGAARRSRLIGDPSLTMLTGADNSFSLQINNIFDADISGTAVVEFPNGWLAENTVPFSVKAGELKIYPLSVPLPKDAKAGEYKGIVKFSYTMEKLPVVNKPFNLSVISSDMVGNLLKNPGFEEEGIWAVKDPVRKRVSSEGLGMGLGNSVYRFEKCAGWEGTGQELELPGGHTYLYTAWVWNKGTGGGSNIYMTMQDGTKKSLYNVAVFALEPQTPYWQMYVSHLKTPDKLKSVSFSPCVKGDGFALYDNMRVTFYEGTDYMAEAYKTDKQPVVDGNLDDFIKTCPIPLIGKNQLKVENDSYKWTPENLNGVAYVNWDDLNLYFGLEVMDDVHKDFGKDDTVIQGDSIILGIDPTGKSPESNSKGFAFYMSTASPGGGSGKTTFYRPAQYSAGLQSGQLARDSSVYEVAIKRGEGKTYYEIRMPFEQLGGARAGFGQKMGFSIQLNDADSGTREAYMSWGDGISPNWVPKDFGLITLVE